MSDRTDAARTSPDFTDEQRQQVVVALETYLEQGFDAEDVDQSVLERALEELDPDREA